VSDSILLDRSHGVATITLNRPEALNAMTVAVKEQLFAAVEEVRDDAAVRAVVITGAGRGFCVGQDLREHAALLEAGDGTPLRTVREHYNPLIRELVALPKPVLAAVNGMAAGAGAALAFACDLRIAGENAAFLMAFARVGLGADSGASWTLPRLVGHARALAMLMLAEPVSATQALEMGLVTAVVPDDRLADAAAELAGRLAAGPTVAYAAIKEALRFAESADLPAALEKEAELQIRAGASADHKAATAAFLAKQPTTFAGR